MSLVSVLYSSHSKACLEFISCLSFSVLLLNVGSLLASCSASWMNPIELTSCRWSEEVCDGLCVIPVLFHSVFGDCLACCQSLHAHAHSRSYMYTHADPN